MNLSTYLYKYLQVPMVHIRETVPLSRSSFTPHFLHFNLDFPLQTSHLPWSDGVGSLSDSSVLITTDNFLAIVFLIYPSLILRLDQHQGNVGANFQMRHFTVEFALWNNRQVAPTLTFNIFTKRNISFIVGDKISNLSIKSTPLIQPMTIGWLTCICLFSFAHRWTSLLAPLDDN